MKKKSKINIWPWGIAISYIIFFLALIIFFIFSIQQDTHLVSENYYQQGIDYQQQIDKVNRTAKLEQSVKWTYNHEAQIVLFQFPENLSTGKIVFYRPSDSNLDRYVRIEKDENSRQSINVNYWQKGFWKIKVDWELDGEKYYNEGSINIK